MLSPSSTTKKHHDPSAAFLMADAKFISIKQNENPIFEPHETVLLCMHLEVKLELKSELMLNRRNTNEMYGIVYVGFYWDRQIVELSRFVCAFPHSHMNRYQQQHKLTLSLTTIYCDCFCKAIIAQFTFCLFNVVSILLRHIWAHTPNFW